MRWQLALHTVTLAGCAHTVPGGAVIDRAQPAGELLPADADEVLLAAADVSDVVGEKLQVDADRSAPIIGS